MQVLWVMVRSLKSIIRAVGSQGIIYGRGLILIHSFRITLNHITHHVCFFPHIIADF